MTVMRKISHLNWDSEMETISFSEDLPSPMSLVHVAHKGTRLHR